MFIIFNIFFIFLCHSESDTFITSSLPILANKGAKIDLVLIFLACQSELFTLIESLRMQHRFPQNSIHAGLVAFPRTL